MLIVKAGPEESLPTMQRKTVRINSGQMNIHAILYDKKGEYKC
jgi:hypothetical protein